MTENDPTPESHFSSDTNSALYAAGRRYAELIARGSAKGENTRSALDRAAAGSGRSRADVRTAVRFADAVGLIVRNVGPAARKALLTGGRHLTPNLVMRIGNTHAERQAYAMAQVALGRHPFSKPRDGSCPPFDTKGVGEVHSRLCRFAGLLGHVSAGLTDTPLTGWPGDAGLRDMARHLAAVRQSCTTLRGLLNGCALAAANVPTLKPRPARGRGRPHTKARRPLLPNRASGLVAAVHGVTEKNVRDLPRVLSEAPPAIRDRDTLVYGVRTLDLAAKELAGVIRLRAGKEAPGANSNGPSAWSRVRHVPDGPDSRPGTYVVVFHVEADADEVIVGRLGTFDFPAGFYCYVGSAFGGGGVGARTARHRTPVKAHKKWNIDYLTPHARAVEVWWTHDEIKRECRWSDALAASNLFTCPAPEFGARDCKKCPAHLYFSARRPRVHDFARRLRQTVPGHAPVYRLRIDRAVRRGGETGKSSGRVAVPRPVPGSKAGRGRLRSFFDRGLTTAI